MTAANTDAIMNQPGRVQALRRMVEAVADGAAPLVDLYRPYVDGLQNLSRDGRFLLVGNHTQASAEGLLIPLLVRRAIGRRVRPLADRNFGRMGGLPGDLLAAAGAVVGAPETARELMMHDEPILVFPGGGREIAKFKGEEYILRWQGRTGFARLAANTAIQSCPSGSWAAITCTKASRHARGDGDGSAKASPNDCPAARTWLCRSCVGSAPH